MELEILFIVITFIVFIVFLLWELYAPARVYTHEYKKNSYITNSGVFIFNNILTYVLSVASIFVIASSLQLHGIFTLLPIPAQYIIGILLLDLLIWFWHMINHRVPFLWSFHQTHHAEKYLNTTSALRFHFGELILAVVFKSFILIILGIPLEIFLMYESLITIFAIYHHANIRLSERIQMILEYVIISPRLHQTHHSDKRSEHDSNYGVLFSWWDILFQTKDKTNPDKIGLSYGGEKNLWSFLIMPLVDRK